MASKPLLFLSALLLLVGAWLGHRCEQEGLVPLHSWLLQVLGGGAVAIGWGTPESNSSSSSSSGGDGGDGAYDLDTSLCTIERIPWPLKGEVSALLPPVRDTPVIYDVGTSWNERFTALVGKERLLTEMGDVQVLLSSSNSYSHDKATASLKHYVTEMMGAGEEGQQSKLSNETFYFFGDNYSPEWNDLVGQYALPPCEDGKETLSALSFGIGSRGSGVAFHTHGAGFSEVFHGAKRWLLFPPGHLFPYDPDRTPLEWLSLTYPLLQLKPLECTLLPGQLLYFPKDWPHAVVNTEEYTTFMSTFL